jgi:hypothetical protein
MNKYSKYRPLMDKVESLIARHMLSSQAVFQYMLEALDEAESIENALRKELETLKANIPKIKADAVRSLFDEGCWDARIDGESYFKGSSIAEYADELEGIN